MDSQIQSALNWRYATKLFNASKKLSEADLTALLTAIQLTPSSMGLQPWKIYVVTNQAVREKLKAAAWNQSQVTDASHLLVFAARKNLDKSYVETYIKKVAEVRHQTEEELARYKQMITGTVASRTIESIKIWNTAQTYIALGILLESAALMKIDTCPMEGFDPAQFDTILELNTTDYTCVVVAAVGYRSDADKYAHAPKVRFEKKDIITFF